MSLAEAERTKYERMWSDPAYRKSSPGERLVDDAIARLGMQPGAPVIDFGCGTGRAAQAMKDRGMLAIGIDHAKNCLDPDVDIFFEQRCLWEMDLVESPVAAFGFCTDVMEHIPPERVNRVLGVIRSWCRDGAYFQIATRPDVMGKRIGETLHLTVQPPDWWRARLGQHWTSVEMDVGSGSVIAVCRS